MRGESLRGFLLRAAELNGYAGQMNLPRLIFDDGYQNAPLSAKDTLARISSKFSIPERELEKIACQYVGADSPDLCKYLGHHISVLHLRSRHPAVCPKCLEEQPAIQAIWDLRAVALCSRHQRWLVDLCPKCRYRLRWHRRGVTECQCGFDLRRIKTQPVTEPVSKMTAAIDEIFFGDLPTFPERELNFSDRFRTAKMSELLGMHRLMQNLLNANGWGASKNPSSISLALEKAGQAAVLLADVLEDWPNGLDALFDLHLDNAKQDATMVRPTGNQLRTIDRLIAKAAGPTRSNVLTQPIFFMEAVANLVVSNKAFGYRRIARSSGTGESVAMRRQRLSEEKAVALEERRAACILRFRNRQRLSEEKAVALEERRAARILRFRNRKASSSIERARHVQSSTEGDPFLSDDK